MLSDMTVLDISQRLPGPYASALLAQLGAEVRKIEPLAGDPSRVLDPAMVEIVTRGMTCVRLNLKFAVDRGSLHDLLRDGDVFLEGFRQGVAARLGADWETFLDTAVVWNQVKASAKDRGEPTSGMYPTADGRLVAVAILEDPLWVRLCLALDWADWARYARLAPYAQRVEQAARIEAITALAGKHDLSITPVDDGGVPAIAKQRKGRGFDTAVPRLPLPLTHIPHEEISR